MREVKIQQITELLKALTAFRNDCNVAPKCNEDLKKYWIIDKQEQKLIMAIEGLLIDCGARISP